MSKKSKLFEYFQGMYVQILLDRDLEQTIQDGDSVSISKFPLSVKGYLVESDDEFLYLTQDISVPEMILITGAARREFVIHIEMGQEDEDQPVEMPNVDLPTRKEEWN